MEFPGIEDTGAAGFSIHPLFPVSSKFEAYRELKDAFFCLEGEEKGMTGWKDLLEKMGLHTQLIADGEKDADKVVAAMVEKIQSEPMAVIDYVSAVNGINMKPVHKIEGTVLVAMAVYIGKTRLIDNFIVEA